MSGRTFGVEEEFMVLDRETLRPVPVGPEAIACVRHTHDARRVIDGRRAVQGIGGAMTAEFLPTQVEHATAVHTSAREATLDLLAFRTAMGAWADVRGYIVCAAGTPPMLPVDDLLVRGDRYQRIARDAGALAQQHHVNGTHVHVGVDDPDDRITVSNGLREWLPLLLALSVNSPLWDGRDTDFASWRTVQARRWTTSGVPPVFADHDEHDRVVARLRGVATIRRVPDLHWDVRLSSAYPTVEIRVCDAQLRASDAVALAELCRSITDHILLERPRRSTAHAVLDAELWHTARHGGDAGVHHPLTGEHRPLHGVLRDVASVLLLSDAATAHVETVAGGASGAESQRRCWPDLARLRDLYSTSFAV